MFYNGFIEVMNPALNRLISVIRLGWTTDENIYFKTTCVGMTK